MSIKSLSYMPTIRLFNTCIKFYHHLKIFNIQIKNGTGLEESNNDIKGSTSQIILSFFFS